MAASGSSKLSITISYRSEIVYYGLLLNSLGQLEGVFHMASESVPYRGKNVVSWKYETFDRPYKGLQYPSLILPQGFFCEGYSSVKGTSSFTEGFFFHLFTEDHSCALL